MRCRAGEVECREQCEQQPGRRTLYEGTWESHWRIDRYDPLRGPRLRRVRDMAVSFQPSYRGNFWGRDCAYWSHSIPDQPDENAGETAQHSQNSGPSRVSGLRTGPRTAATRRSGENVTREGDETMTRGIDLFPWPLFRGIGMHISRTGEVWRETLS